MNHTAENSIIFPNNLVNNFIHRFFVPTAPKWVHLVLIITFSIVLVGYLFGPNLNAQWWIIDDHEIASYLGPDKRSPVSEIAPRFMGSEVRSYGKWVRFRPTYYLLRFTEISLLGNHPKLWYITRLCIMLIFLIVLWRYLIPHLGFSLASLITFYTVTFSYWGDIISRLGPSETYAVFGCAVYIVAFHNLYHQKSSSPFNWFLIFLGVTICAGSKENFVLIIIPTVYLFALLHLRNHRQSFLSWIFLLLSLAWVIWISIAIVLGTAQTNQDVYGRSTAMVDRLALLIDALFKKDLIVLYALAIIGLLAASFFRIKSRTSLVKISLKASYYILLLILLYLSQVIFYNGSWPQDSRYDFPGMLYLPLLFALIAWYIFQILHQLEIPRQVRLGIYIALLICGVALAATHIKAANQLRASSLKNVQRSIEFTRKLTELTILANKVPDRSFILQSSETIDYEPVHSYPAFLRFFGVTNPLYFTWLEEEATIETDWHKWLADRLAKLSMNGSNHYLPIEQVRPDETRCILVVLSGTPAYPCKVIFDASWR